MQQTEKNTKRNKLRDVLVIISAFVFGLMIPARFSVTVTPSLDKRVYLISRIPRGQHIDRNSYVLFKGHFAQIEGGRALQVMKIARCIPKDDLFNKDKDYYCNGNYLGTAKEFSKKGERLINFKFNGIVPPEKLFVMGQHRDSYDSRYFGFIEEKDVFAIGHPIF